MTDGIERDMGVQDTRTPFQKAVDMAWRAEKIDLLLRSRGEPERADQAARVMITTLFLLDPSDIESAEVITAYLGGLIEECDGYDSGARKFEQLPELPD